MQSFEVYTEYWVIVGFSGGSMLKFNLDRHYRVVTSLQKHTIVVCVEVMTVICLLKVIVTC